MTQNNGDASLVEEGRNRAGYCHACYGMQGHRGPGMAHYCRPERALC